VVDINGTVPQYYGLNILKIVIINNSTSAVMNNVNSIIICNARELIGASTVECTAQINSASGSAVGSNDVTNYFSKVSIPAGGNITYTLPDITLQLYRMILRLPEGFNITIKLFYNEISYYTMTMSSGYCVLDFVGKNGLIPRFPCTTIDSDPYAELKLNDAFAYNSFDPSSIKLLTAKSNIDTATGQPYVSINRGEIPNNLIIPITGVTFAIVPIDTISNFSVEIYYLDNNTINVKQCTRTIWNIALGKSTPTTSNAEVVIVSKGSSLLITEETTSKKIYAIKVNNEGSVDAKFFIDIVDSNNVTYRSLVCNRSGIKLFTTGRVNYQALIASLVNCDTTGVYKNNAYMSTTYNPLKVGEAHLNVLSPKYLPTSTAFPDISVTSTRNMLKNVLNFYIIHYEYAPVVIEDFTIHYKLNEAPNEVKQVQLNGFIINPTSKTTTVTTDPTCKYNTYSDATHTYPVRIGAMDVYAFTLPNLVSVGIYRVVIKSSCEKNIPVILKYLQLKTDSAGIKVTDLTQICTARYVQYGVCLGTNTIAIDFI
jgi:hypothetical protein